MPIGGDEISVDRFMTDVHEKRLVIISRIQPVDRVVGQLVGDVTLLRNTFSVDVKSIVRGLRNFACCAVAIRPVRSLAFESDPVVESSLRIIDVSALVPLTNECRFVTSFL